MKPIPLRMAADLLPQTEAGTARCCAGLRDAGACGIPVPADDHQEGRLDIAELCWCSVLPPPFRAGPGGPSMRDCSIRDGDLLMVDRIQPHPGDVVVAVVDGGLRAPEKLRRDGLVAAAVQTFIMTDRSGSGPQHSSTMTLLYRHPLPTPNRSSARRFGLLLCAGRTALPIARPREATAGLGAPAGCATWSALPATRPPPSGADADHRHYQHPFQQRVHSLRSTRTASRVGDAPKIPELCDQLGSYSEGQNPIGVLRAIA